jgi:uncharacterized protein DUF6930
MSQAKTKHRETKPQPPAGPPPERFFQKDLPGEEAPSFQTMQSLFIRAADVHTSRPWNNMEEDQLVVVEHPASHAPCYCSVMGSLGEARAVQVYIGEESYFWFRKLQAGVDASLGDFFANQHSLFVHFVNPGDLTPPDRELAKSMKHSLAKGTEVPLFRTIRPGYHPWFITESEARILAAGLEAVLVVCNVLSKEHSANLWSEEGIYPLIQLYGERGDHWEYTIKSAAAPAETARMPKLPDLDQHRIQSILDQGLPSAGTLEVDHFHGAGMIGAKHERKACFRIALAIDSKTGFAFPPEVGAPEASTGDLLQRVILRAIAAKHALPLEIHVSNHDFKILLEPLAQALGVQVKVRKSLQALEFAKSEMQSMFGDPGFAH